MQYSGNGIYAYCQINSVENSGVISGKSKIFGNEADTGNGIFNTYEGINKIKNTGIIKGETVEIYAFSAGNGVSLDAHELGDLVNGGVISGSSPKTNGLDYQSGNGVIAFSSHYKNIIHDIKNSGVIRGNNAAIYTDSINRLKNFGILSGMNIFKENSVVNKEENYGSYVHVINGAGIETGALHIVGKTTTITDTTVNGIGSTICLSANDSELIANNSIINGDIKGDNTSNKINISGNSIINGTINLGGGFNTVSISNDVMINGNISNNGTSGELNLGSKTTKSSSNLNLYHDITGFGKIISNGNITIYEDSNIKTPSFQIESGDVTLRVDTSKKDGDKIIGHALYNEDTDISLLGGNLILGMNGINEKSTVAMGGNIYGDKTSIKTNSLVLVSVVDNKGNVVVDILDSLPLPPETEEPEIIPPIPDVPGVVPPIPDVPDVTPPIPVDGILYGKLNKIYKSINSAKEVGTLKNTTLITGDRTAAIASKELIALLDQIYANNPYAYSIKMSKDTLKLFSENLSYMTITPQSGDTIVQGRVLYNNISNDNVANGKNYYGFDTGHRNFKTTSTTTGGLATYEYGIADNTSLGLAFGGANQKAKFKGMNDLKGNSIYLGIFAKKKIRNIKLTAGIGYQYSSLDAKRVSYNKYDTFKTNERYDINSFNLFTEGRYIFKLNETLSIQPKIKLSYYNINQDEINEGYKKEQLSIAVNNYKQDKVELDLGIDTVKNIYLENKKLNLIASFSAVNYLGDKQDILTGNVLGATKKGSDFDIQGVETPKISGKIGMAVELEKINGMIYTAKIDYEFSKNNNKNIQAKIGIGYKF